ncbi:amidohydrolase/deacetylase family metallohydrolase [Streptomyces albiaxialis]|uniref:Amidohydrolase/deacetylase family metallohydrolase n=1 Tax=Streptomyces albiaxialis TaxID=329523 RepID=A0ABP5I9C4_9ACTN
MAVRDPEANPSPERLDLVISGGLLAGPDGPVDFSGPSDPSCPEYGDPVPGDLGVRDGRIVRVAGPGTLAASQEAGGAGVFDATGLLVAPGLIDLHTHVYDGRTGLGIPADDAGVRQGVTTVVDAGSCGSDDWAHFAAHITPHARTRVLNWLNVSRHGLVQGTRELAGGAADLDPEATARLLVRHRDTVRGVKVRMSGSVLGESGLAPLRAAKELTARAGRELGRRVPVMVHVGNEPPRFGDVLELLGEGDVVTHAFHGKPGGLFAGGDRPVPEVTDAVERGVRLDVGHGSASFSFRTAERALDAGLRPYTASTDLHRRNADGPVHSLATTLTKLLALGLPLAEVLACATDRAAEVLGLRGELGTLRPGAPADLSLLELREEPVELTDAEGEKRTARRALVPRAVVRAGTLRRLAPEHVPAPSPAPDENRPA